MKPIIGIIAKPLSNFECPDDIWTEDYIKDEFREIIFRNNCLAIGVLPPFQTAKYNNDESDNVLKNNFTQEEKSDIDSILEKCNGFILQGGLSGDYYEAYIADYAVRKNIPILGICAGFNMLARIVGGKIVSANDLGIKEKEHNVYDKNFRHTVDIVNNSTLYNIFQKDVIDVNSLHTYFLDTSFLRAQQTRIEVNATTTNKLENTEICTTVEAFTIKNTRFAMGIKWHPEIMEEEHKQKLFSLFLTECKKCLQI